MSVLPRAIVLPLLLLLASCGVRTEQRAEWTGPLRPAGMRTEAWGYPLAGSRVLVTAHYRLHTDLPEAANSGAAAQVLEGAYQQYRAVAGAMVLSPAPLNGYLFASRSAWDAFTRANTGEDAAVYLQVSRGAYTVNDWFAAYWLDERATWSVLAHEGWHQFAARQFAGRLPPSLEEGMACLFENIRWQGPVPRWNLASNPSREQGLRLAQEQELLLPLAELLRLHAGDMVGQRPPRVQAYYAESWALARFLMEGEGGRYCIGFERLLADTAAGRAWLPPQFSRPDPRAWNAALAVPTTEHYLGARLTEIEPQFRRFVRRLLRDVESQQTDQRE